MFLPHLKIMIGVCCLPGVGFNLLVQSRPRVVGPLWMNRGNKYALVKYFAARMQ
jgi:hypothetical protein